MKETELLVANAVKETDKPVNTQSNGQNKVDSLHFGISFTSSLVDQASLIKNSFAWGIKW